MANGIRIRSTSYVGTIKIGDLNITIRPKMEIQVTLQFVALHLRPEESSKVFDRADHGVGQQCFQDVLIHQLLVESIEILGRGLRKEYRQTRESLKT